MIARKKLQKIAKVMYKNSFSGLLVDPKKVSRNLKIISQQKPQGATKILTIYKKLIQKTLSQEEIIVEAPQKLAPAAEKDLLKRTGARKLIYNIKPDMVFGAKVTAGDWIFENDLDTKIRTLTNIA